MDYICKTRQVLTVETAWQWDGYYTYIRLIKGTNIADFEKKMNEFTDKQTEADISAV